MVSKGGISVTLLHQSVSTTCDVGLCFAFSQRAFERTHLCIGLLKALGEILAVLLVLFAWLLLR